MSDEIERCPVCGKAPDISTLGSCIDIECCVSRSVQKCDVLQDILDDEGDGRRWSDIPRGSEPLDDFEDGYAEKILQRAIEEWNPRPIEDALREKRDYYEKMFRLCGEDWKSEYAKLETGLAEAKAEIEDIQKNFHINISEVERLNKSLEKQLADAQQANLEQRVKGYLDAVDWVEERTPMNDMHGDYLKRHVLFRAFGENISPEIELVGETITAYLIEQGVTG